MNHSPTKATVTKTTLALVGMICTGEGILFFALALLIECAFKDKGRLREALCRWTAGAGLRPI